MYFKFAMMLKSPWHFHVQLSVISHTSQVFADRFAKLVLHVAKMSLVARKR